MKAYCLLALSSMFILLLSIPINALTINPQDDVACYYNYCSVSVDMSKYVNPITANSLKAVDLSSSQPAKTATMKNFKYAWVNSTITFTADIAPNSSNYWIMDLNGVATIDPWFNSTTWSNWTNPDSLTGANKDLSNQWFGEVFWMKNITTNTSMDIYVGIDTNIIDQKMCSIWKYTNLTSGGDWIANVTPSGNQCYFHAITMQNNTNYTILLASDNRTYGTQHFPYTSSFFNVVIRCYKYAGTWSYAADNVFDFLSVNMTYNTSSFLGTNLTINNNSANLTAIYNDTALINFTAWDFDPTYWVAITRNGTLMSNGTSSTTYSTRLAVGFYNISAIDNSSASTYWLNITKASNKLEIFPLNTSITYGTYDTPYCVDNVTVDCSLYRNGTLLSNNTQELLGGGVWNYTTTIADTQNYTTTGNFSFFTVNNASNPMSLTFTLQNGSSYTDNGVVLNFYYPNTVNLTATGQGALNIFRNSNCSGYPCPAWTSITSQNNTYVILAANNPQSNYYAHFVNSTGNQNYSINNSDIGYWSIRILQSTPNINITFNTSDTIIQGTPVMVTCNKPDELSIGLYNDTNNVGNNYNFTPVSQGSYNFTCNTTGSTNYTGATANNTLYVTATGGLSVYVYNEENTAQGLTFNITINNGTASNTANNQGNPYTNSSITGSITIDITASGYQQRTFYVTQGSNATILNAYLLPASSGSWIIFYVYTATEQPIQSALINAERLLPPASWLTVAQKKTDSSGSAAIFLSSTTTYRLNFSAAGYTNQSLQLQPAASPYVIYMLASSGLNISYNTSYKNLYLWIEPNGTALYSNESYVFRYYIFSSDNMLQYEGWQLTYSNGTQILMQNSTNAGGVTYTSNIDTNAYSSGYIDFNYWFKKYGFGLVNATQRYYIYGVHAYNTSIMAEVADIAAGVAAGTPDVTMQQFAFISMLISIICMAAASSQYKMFGSGIFGLMILSMFTFMGTYIWGSDYIIGWELLGMMGLGVIAAIYIRGGFG